MGPADTKLAKQEERRCKRHFLQEQTKQKEKQRKSDFKTVVKVSIDDGSAS